MEWPTLGDEVDAAYFDEIYSRDEDPWKYAEDPYELNKYAKQIGWLTEGGRERFGRGLEVACAIGVFTRMLAAVCDNVDAFDISPVAVDRAKKNLEDVSNVRLDVAEFPDADRHPPDAYDVITVAEVLYYFDLEALLKAKNWIHQAVKGGARVLVVDYAPADRVGFGGEIVHDVLAKELRDCHRRGERWPDTGFDEQGRAYRMDLFRSNA
jgi:SAM-dependent methyltransferase